ncbi:MAG: sulfate permease [Chlamydiota bacterium]
MYKEFIPKSYLCLRSNYTFSIFKKDVIAGVTVGVIALPLAMAFAIASGVTPFQGLITAVIAGFCISAFGGSKVQIGGPTGAFVILIYDIVQRNGYEGLVAATLLGAFFLLCLGIFRVGSWIKYVPYPLITGFTTGLAVLIFSSQIKDFLGLSITNLPCHFVGKWSLYFTTMSTCELSTLCLSAGSLILILLVRKFIPKLPWAITAITLSTLVAYIFSLPVETIYSRFGEIPNHFPSISFPKITISNRNLTEIFLDGMAIAFLGGIESLLSAVIGDGMTGGRHKSNCELMGQGIANFASVLFGGIPATGAIARTAVNIKSGAKTPVAGMVHALTLLAIILFLAPVISYIPLPTLSAVLIMVAWNMSEIDHFIKLFKAPIGDVLILLTAFFLTVFVDITIAICFGMVLASFLFMKRMSQFPKTISLTKEFSEEADSPLIISQKNYSNIEIYEIQGPFFFGAADILQDVLTNIERAPKVFILKLHDVTFIDASGMHALKEFYERCKKEKTILLLAELQGEVKKDLVKFGFIKTLGKEHVFPSLEKALAKAKEEVNKN